jgi:hypothetical protein
MGQTFGVESEGSMSTSNRVNPPKGLGDRCAELLKRLGNVPLEQLTPEERQELREATDGMFRPSDKEKRPRPRK